jgi:hypothetical protein
MIHDLDKTLEKLMYERGRMSRNDIDISFDQPNGDWSSRLARPTISMWAFDLHENVKLRNMDRPLTRMEGMGKRTLAPLRLDVTYLVTAWARKVEDEHQLLWRAISAFGQTFSLEPSDCEGALKDQPYPLPMIVANIPERIASLSDLWSVLNNQMRLGFTFTITLALITGQEIEAPLVLESTVRVGQSQYPLSQTLTALDVEMVEKGDPETAPDGAFPANRGTSSDAPKKGKTK